MKKLIEDAILSLPTEDEARMRVHKSPLPEVTPPPVTSGLFSATKYEEVLK